MLRIHPDLSDDALLRLFEKGVEKQWPDRLLDWTAEESWDATSMKALAAVLTPVYLGEQTAMLGVSATLPKILHAGDTEAALYLSSMGLDEARHFHNLTRLYDRWGIEPWPTRRLPEMWRYHARLLRSGDPIDWLWGILISDLFAKEFYGQIRTAFPDLLVGRLAQRTLVDEARHQAFADRYLAPRLQRVAPTRAAALLELRDDLFRTMEALSRRLEAPLTDLGWSGAAFLQRLWQETERWASRLHLTAAPIEPQPPSPAADAGPVAHAAG